MDWLSISALGIAIVAVILAILALVFGGGTQGPQGPQGPQGNNGTNGGPIITGETEAVYDTVQNCYILPPIYNGYNIVIPEIPPQNTNNIKINASQVKNGDVFTIDNTNNASLFFYIQTSGFDNNIEDNDEVVLNSGTVMNGRQNTALVNITVGKTISTNNIFIFINGQ